MDNLHADITFIQNPISISITPVVNGIKGITINPSFNRIDNIIIDHESPKISMQIQPIADSSKISITILKSNQKGDKGDKGDGGAGVPTGGIINQKLVKASSNDYDTQWVDDIPYENNPESGTLIKQNGLLTGINLETYSIDIQRDINNKISQIVNSKGTIYRFIRQDGAITGWEVS